MIRAISRAAWCGRSWAAAAAIVGGAALACPAEVAAQYQQQKGMTLEELKKKKEVEISGTVAQIQAGVVVLKTATNEPMAVMVVPDRTVSTVNVTGTADPSFLGSGVYISFQGVVEEKEPRTFVLKDPVAEVNLMTYDPRLIAEDPTLDSDSTIQGKLLLVKEGHFTIQLFGKKIKKVSGVFAGEPKITLALTDLGYVKPGDTVAGKARVPDDKKPMQVVGTTLNVTLAEPLRGKRKWVPAADAPKTEEKKEEAKSEEKKAE